MFGLTTPTSVGLCALVSGLWVEVRLGGSLGGGDGVGSCVL